MRVNEVRERCKKGEHWFLLSFFHSDNPHRGLSDNTLQEACIQVYKIKTNRICQVIAGPKCLYCRKKLLRAVFSETASTFSCCTE
jgi:hypothetical protein